MEKLEHLPFAEYKDQLFKRLEEVVSYESLTQEEQAQYDRDWKWAADYEETAMYQYDQGFAQGEAAGEAKGRVEGKWESARNFYGLGIDIATISKATGIPEAELREAFENN